VIDDRPAVLRAEGHSSPRSSSECRVRGKRERDDPEVGDSHADVGFDNAPPTPMAPMRLKELERRAPHAARLWRGRRLRSRAAEGGEQQDGRSFRDSGLVIPNTLERSHAGAIVDAVTVDQQLRVAGKDKKEEWQAAPGFCR